MLLFFCISYLLFSMKLALEDVLLLVRGDWADEVFI
jgi:hypothetical protein